MAREYRQAQETPKGLEEIEAAIEQYHVEKEARLEQEELIRQQLALVEQRKAAEAANKDRQARQDMRNSIASNGIQQSEELAKGDSSALKKKESNTDK